MPQNSRISPAEELVSRMFWLVERLRSHFDETAARFDLPPTWALTIRALERPLSMGQLAGVLRCEPSNVTALIGQMEQSGLVERRTASEDRRVRKILLTARGRRLRTRFGNELFAELPFAALSVADSRRLLGLLRQIGVAWPGPSYRTLGSPAGALSDAKD